MSRKKIYTSMGIAEDVFNRIEEQATSERRSRSFIVEKVLREYFALPYGEGKEEKVNANKA